MVIGATIMAKKEIFERYPFEELGRGEDTAFMRAVSDAGGKIYASDRYNYYVHRSASGHTWTASDDQLLASGDIQFWGNPKEHVTV